MYNIVRVSAQCKLLGNNNVSVSIHQLQQMYLVLDVNEGGGRVHGGWGNRMYYGNLCISSLILL